MAIDGTALASISASLEDLTNRLGNLASAADEDEEHRIDLLEIERQLQTSSRRLAKVVRRTR